MSIIDNIIKNIDVNRIKNLTGDMYELAIARMVCIEMSKYYYRDEVFFLFKENLEDRENIYNSFPTESQRNITCNSLCKILENILGKHFNLDVKINSVFSDKFAHKDIILTTRDNKKYIINPLMDLVEYKVGFETTNFASKKMADFYKKKISDIDFISKEQLLEIDETIGYAKDGKYKNIDSISCDNIETALTIIMGLRGYINGIVDLKIFSSLKLKMLMGKEYDMSDIYIDKKNIKDELLKELEFNNNNRYRGLIVQDNNFVYLFPVNNSYIKYSITEWENLIKNNSISINSYAYVENLPKLKEYGVDRNILHNRKFLEIFSYYENLCKQDGKNILDYIEYTKNYIRVNYKCNILFYIDGNHLSVIDYSNKNKHKYIFTDESSIKEEKHSFVCLGDKRLLNEYIEKTDVLGMFEMQVDNSEVLDYVTNYDNKFLSRNYKQYYVFDSIKDLLNRRDKIINIIESNNSLSNDEKYVLLENILNISARLYYLSGLSNIVEKHDEIIDKNYQMLVNDITNFISFMMNLNIPFNFKDYENISSNFDVEMVLHNKKQVELDNKVYILSYVRKLIELINDLGLKDYFVITPGYGSIYLGPFISSMTDKKSSLLLYSQYKKTGIEQIDGNDKFTDLIVNSSKIDGKPIILIDDNMGTGTTIKMIKNQLINNGYDVSLAGSYQYTFDRLQEFTIRNRGQELFSIYEQDLLTPLNYPRHQILETAITKFADSSKEYVKYLNLFGYHSELRSDYQQMQDDALFYYSRFTGKEIDRDDSLKATSKMLIKKFKGE